MPSMKEAVHATRVSLVACHCVQSVPLSIAIESRFRTFMIIKSRVFENRILDFRLLFWSLLPVG